MRSRLGKGRAQNISHIPMDNGERKSRRTQFCIQDKGRLDYHEYRKGLLGKHSYLELGTIQNKGKKKEKEMLLPVINIFGRKEPKSSLIPSPG